MAFPQINDSKLRKKKKKIAGAQINNQIIVKCTLKSSNNGICCK